MGYGIYFAYPIFSFYLSDSSCVFSSLTIRPLMRQMWVRRTVIWFFLLVLLLSYIKYRPYSFMLCSFSIDYVIIFIVVGFKFHRCFIVGLLSIVLFVPILSYEVRLCSTL